MAKKRKKPKMEFRYYQMPAGSPILALLGQKWVQNYGNDVIIFIFIIIWRLVSVTKGMELWRLVRLKCGFREENLR